MEIFYSHLEIVYKLRAAKFYVLFKKILFQEIQEKTRGLCLFSTYTCHVQNEELTHSVHRKILDPV